MFHVEMLLAGLSATLPTGEGLIVKCREFAVIDTNNPSFIADTALHVVAEVLPL